MKMKFKMCEFRGVSHCIFLSPCFSLSLSLFRSFSLSLSLCLSLSLSLSLYTSLSLLQLSLFLSVSPLSLFYSLSFLQLSLSLSLSLFSSRYLFSFSVFLKLISCAPTRTQKYKNTKKSQNFLKTNSSKYPLRFLKSHEAHIQYRYHTC